MIELTFFAGHRMIRFQIRNDKSIWAYDFRLKTWIPSEKANKDIKGNKIDFISEKEFIKTHTINQIAKDIIEEMAKGGAKLISRK